MSAHNGTGRETEDGEKLRIRTGKSSWYKSNMRTSGRSDSAERSNKRKEHRALDLAIQSSHIILRGTFSGTQFP